MLRLGFVPETVLDIGANVGEWTRAARGQWPDAAFLLIEANPGCKGHLHASGEDYLIALLGAQRKAAVPFYSLDPIATGASVYKELTGLYDKVEPVMLPQTTLDDLLPGRWFDFIKMDTQGSELDIIAGGREMFSKAKAVQMEISLKPYNKGAPIGDEVFRKMGRLGFAMVQQIDFCDSIQQGDYLFLRMG